MPQTDSGTTDMVILVEQNAWQRKTEVRRVWVARSVHVPEILESSNDSRDLESCKAVDAIGPGSEGNKTVKLYT